MNQANGSFKQVNIIIYFLLSISFNNQHIFLAHCCWRLQKKQANKPSVHRRVGTGSTCGASEVGIYDLLAVRVQIYEHPQDELPRGYRIPLRPYEHYCVNTTQRKVTRLQLSHLSIKKQHNLPMLLLIDSHLLNPYVQCWLILNKTIAVRSNVALATNP